jgi:hypothetical protein
MPLDLRFSSPLALVFGVLCINELQTGHFLTGLLHWRLGRQPAATATG